MENKKYIKKGLIIGRSEIFDCPERTFDLVSCLACQSLFNTKGKENKIITCPTCKEKIKIIMEEEK